MSETIKQIADRIREAREISEITTDTLARRLNLPIDTYLKYENAEDGVPISTLYEIAGILGIEMTQLLTGSTPRLHNYSYTKAGEAPDIERFEGYRFQSPAYNFANKLFEPLLVTIDPEENKKMALVAHSGQEFNYVLEG